MSSEHDKTHSPDETPAISHTNDSESDIYIYPKSGREVRLRDGAVPEIVPIDEEQIKTPQPPMPNRVTGSIRFLSQDRIVMNSDEGIDLILPKPDESTH